MNRTHYYSSFPSNQFLITPILFVRILRSEKGTETKGRGKGVPQGASTPLSSSQENEKKGKKKGGRGREG